MPRKTIVEVEYHQLDPEERHMEWFTPKSGSFIAFVCFAIVLLFVHETGPMRGPTNIGLIDVGTGAVSASITSALCLVYLFIGNQIAREKSDEQVTFMKHKGNIALWTLLTPWVVGTLLVIGGIIIGIILLLIVGYLFLK